MNEVTATGIVLASGPIGEYDRRVELLTGEMGRISAFARGARRPSSSLVAVSRVFAFGTFKLIQGRESYSLSSAQITNYFTELSADFELSCYGSYFLELARYFSRENMEARESLNLLYLSLRALSREIADNRLIRAVYELRTLEINGICPSIDKLRLGEGRFGFGASMSAAASYAYEYVISSPVEKVLSFSLKEEALVEFASVCKRLVKMLTDKQFNSLILLESFE